MIQTNRIRNKIRKLSMTLIDFPLSEVVVVSEVFYNMSHCGGTRCVFFDLRVYKKCLSNMRNHRGFPVINHTKTIDPENHLNESQLHLYRYGNIEFTKNFKTFLCNLD